MKSTFNICFYAKKDKQKANGAYPLFARITVDGVASRFNSISFVTTNGSVAGNAGRYW